MPVRKLMSPPQLVHKLQNLIDHNQSWRLRCLYLLLGILQCSSGHMSPLTKHMSLNHVRLLSSLGVFVILFVICLELCSRMLNKIML